MSNHIPIIREGYSTGLKPRPFKEVYSIFDVSRARRLGAGGFGKVYVIKKKDSGEKYAAKYQKFSNEKLRALAHDEATYLKELASGKRIVRIFEYYEKNEHSLMVLEYLEGGELFSKVGASSYNLTEEKCKKFVIEIIKAINFVHEKSLVHLDIKPQNIMMRNRKDEFKIKLIDFGLTKRLREGRVLTGFVGTVGFMAPEVANAQYGKKEKDFATPATDLFSIGVVTYMLVSGGREPFWDGSDTRAIKNTLKKEVTFNHPEFKHVTDEAKDFIRELLVKDQYRRMSGNKALGHSWLKVDTDWPDSNRPQSRYTRVETATMRRFVARAHWKRAIKAVRTMIKVKNHFAIPRQETIARQETFGY